MSDETSMRTIWVPRHPGWQGQRGSMTAVAVMGALFGLVVLGYAAILISDAAAAMKLLGACVIAAFALAAWMTVEHLRVARKRVVRATAGSASVVFKGVTGTAWPMRLLGVAGVALLAAWAWALFSVPAGRLTTLTVLLLPVVGALLVYGGARAWLRRPGAHCLTLTPERVVLRIPRNNLDVGWTELAGAALEENRVTLHAASSRPASWAVRDLASDPVILADLLTFYAGTPSAREEIGEATLQRLRDGDLPTTTTHRGAPSTGNRHH